MSRPCHCHAAQGVERPPDAQPPRPPRPSLSICCHHSDDPKAAAWTLDVRKEIAIQVAIRHSVTFRMTCLMLLGSCSGNVPRSAASALRRSPDICRWQLFRLVTLPSVGRKTSARRPCLTPLNTSPAHAESAQGLAESARGVSPRAAHRSVRERLHSHGSCHPLKAAAFRRNQRAHPVDRWLVGHARVTCPLRSTGITPLHHYYEAVRPWPAPWYFRPRGFSACTFSLDIAEQVLKFRTRARMRVTPPKHRTPHGQ